MYCDKKFKLRHFSGPHVSQESKEGSSWCKHFIEQKGLVLFQKTKIAQKLLDTFENKIIDFQQFIQKIHKEHNFPLLHIGNMNEIPINFNIVRNQTVNSKGVKIVLVKTTGHTRTCSAVVLMSVANRTKLKQW